MRKLSLKELQFEEKEILKKTIKFLNANNIEYFIYAGTLLGAIRHKGFIPWDDDIDIAIMRKDYDRMISILNQNNKISDDLEVIGFELNNGNHPFCKVINKKISIKENVNVDKYLWIDIFPLDNCPSGDVEAEKFLKKVFIKHQIISLKLMTFSDVLRSSKTLLRRIMKIIVWPLTIFINLEKYEKEYINFCKKYNSNETKYISNVVWNVSSKHYFDKKITLNTKMLEFEDLMVSGFEDYDYFLKRIYGDYMKLPTENKRYSHSFEAYKD